MIAALYVETGGVYYGLPDVDPWDEERDARLYAGPWPVVAHPPCNKWSPLAYTRIASRAPRCKPLSARGAAADTQTAPNPAVPAERLTGPSTHRNGLTAWLTLALSSTRL